MSETRMQHWSRRGRELNKRNKRDLCALYRRMGGLGGVHPPEKWRKDEVVTSIIDMEWDRLPEDQKKPDPQRFSPPCDVCGKGQNAVRAHQWDGDHSYVYTFDPDKAWVSDDLEAEPAPVAREGRSPVLPAVLPGGE